MTDTINSTTKTIRIITARWEEYHDTLRAIRHEVFVEGQGVPLTEEQDGRDDNAHHWLAFDGERAVATARLLPSGQVGRMAVIAPYRNRGLGARVLQQVIATAGERGFQRLHLHAQVDAINFYQRAGFVACGEEFWEAGIRHRSMELVL